MATEDYNTTFKTPPPLPPQQPRKIWPWVAAAVAVLAVVIAVAMPGTRDAGDSTTTGTPPATDRMPLDTTPNATPMDSVPAPAAVPPPSY